MKIWRRSVGVAPIKFEAFVATALGVPHSDGNVAATKIFRIYAAGTRENITE